MNPSMILLAPLVAGILACGLATLAQETPGNPRPAIVDDEGVFEILLAGRAIGTESFKIHTSLGKVEAQAEIYLHVEQNGKTVGIESFPDLVLNPQLRPLTYTWKQKGPQSSRLEVDFRSKLAKVRYKTVNGDEDNRAFELPPDVAVLDDNVVHHYQLIIDRYQGMGAGKQTIPVFVPQEALPGLITVQDMGNAPITIARNTSNLRHLLMTTDLAHIDLWIDNQQHIQRVSVPTVQLEAIRKR
jgi:hypothetical protein